MCAGFSALNSRPLEFCSWLDSMMFNRLRHTARAGTACSKVHNSRYMAHNKLHAGHEIMQLTHNVSLCRLAMFVRTLALIVRHLKARRSLSCINDLPLPSTSRRYATFRSVENRA